MAITNQPNMGRKQIFEELPEPSKVDMSQILLYVYKGIYILVKLALDHRLNLLRISEGKKITRKHERPKQDNPVIKDTDKLK